MVSRLSCLHITPQTSKPSSMLSVILGGGLYNGFAVHSASPHSLVSIKKRTKYKKDKTGKIIGIDDSDLKNIWLNFHTNLCQNFAN
jgi:hypothetical protein